MNDAIQNSAEPFVIFADDETAIGTGKTGLTITATLCKNGQTEFFAVTPTHLELGGGWYRVTPIAAHRDTLGEQVWAFAATGAIIAGRREVVKVAFSNATIADAVWDEQYSQHKAAGTFGKLFDIWRKSNPAIDGVVTASVTPTTTTFSTNITGYPSGAFIHSVLLFVNGSTNAESNSPIIGYVSANGVITLEEPMQQAVQVGDEFVIAANSHVHSIATIAAGIWNSLLATYQAVGSFGKAIADTKADTTAILASAGVNVLPAVGISASRAPGVFLSPFVGELISQSITVYASDGTTPIDLSGKTLEIVFEARGGGDIAVIADANITISGGDDNVVTFAYPSAVTAQERTLRFSLRDAGTPFTVYLTGLCKVSIAPSNDPA
jgi:hypothetical protein